MSDAEKCPLLYLVVPCYNEKEVLPLTVREFTGKLHELIVEEKIHADSKILYVDDGSTDSTWDVIMQLAKQNDMIMGISLSRNRGHQNALLAGLLEVKDVCDVCISMDCDGQDDVDAIEAMLAEYAGGAEIVYGVRSDRSHDSWKKRTGAHLFYRGMRVLGAESIPEHGDFRLLDSRVLQELSRYEEVNLYLRGMVPMVGFKSTCVYYTRKPRLAGETHYPLKKEIALALDGITSLTVRPIRLITGLGYGMAGISFLGIIWAVVRYFMGSTVWGWASTTCIICLVSGIQLICIGVIGEYIGKIYLEVKHRPRFVVESRTTKQKESA